MECPRLDLLKTINDLNNALDYCEANCHKYYRCDDVMIMNDKLVELEVSATNWPQPKPLILLGFKDFNLQNF